MKGKMMETFKFDTITVPLKDEYEHAFRTIIALIRLKANEPNFTLDVTADLRHATHYLWQHLMRYADEELDPTTFYKLVNDWGEKPLADIALELVEKNAPDVFESVSAAFIE
jgi:hypothetical protein